MSRINFSLAWSDEDFLDSLTDDQRSKVPDCPVGTIELLDGCSAETGAAVLRIAGHKPIQFSLWSILANCENISNAMSSTSTCCCYAIPTPPS